MKKLLIFYEIFEVYLSCSSRHQAEPPTVTPPFITVTPPLLRPAAMKRPHRETTLLSAVAPPVRERRHHRPSMKIHQTGNRSPLSLHDFQSSPVCAAVQKGKSAFERNFAAFGQLSKSAKNLSILRAFSCLSFFRPCVYVLKNPFRRHCLRDCRRGGNSRRAVPRRNASDPRFSRRWSA